jgi:hypothetical protein
MSLRDELATVIRLKTGTTELGDRAVQGANEGESAWGSTQDVMDMLVNYCGGLETAVLRLADEVEDLRLGRGEAES